MINTFKCRIFFNHWNKPAKMINGSTSGVQLLFSAKLYKRMMWSRVTHRAYGWLWRSSCQMNPKMFFWLVLEDRLNTTRGLLRRKNMELDSYDCEMCIWLFVQCKACWTSIGINLPHSNIRKRVITLLKRRITFLNGGYHSFDLGYLVYQEWLDLQQQRPFGH
jgi:hypothetical protein